MLKLRYYITHCLNQCYYQTWWPFQSLFLTWSYEMWMHDLELKNINFLWLWLIFRLGCNNRHPFPSGVFSLLYSFLVFLFSFFVFKAQTSYTCERFNALLRTQIIQTLVYLANRSPRSKGKLKKWGFALITELPNSMSS